MVRRYGRFLLCSVTTGWDDLVEQGPASTRGRAPRQSHGVLGEATAASHGSYVHRTTLGRPASALGFRTSERRVGALYPENPARAVQSVAYAKRWGAGVAC